VYFLLYLKFIYFDMANRNALPIFSSSKYDSPDINANGYVFFWCLFNVYMHLLRKSALLFDLALGAFIQ